MKKKTRNPQHRRPKSLRCAPVIESDEGEASIQIFISVFIVIVSHWVPVDEPGAKTLLAKNTSSAAKNLHLNIKLLAAKISNCNY